MNIRLEQADDINTICDVIYLAFENHPHHQLGAKPTEHLIVNDLRTAGELILSLVAQDETGIVGHIAFSPVMVANKHCNFFGLGPVSVLPQRQNEGIGAKLIHAGLTALKYRKASDVVLLGEPQYYTRFGFTSYPEFTLPGVPAEYFVATIFNHKDNALPTGDVTYHRAFEQ